MIAATTARCIGHRSTRWPAIAECSTELMSWFGVMERTCVKSFPLLDPIKDMPPKTISLHVNGQPKRRARHGAVSPSRLVAYRFAKLPPRRGKPYFSRPQNNSALRPVTWSLIKAPFTVAANELRTQNS